MPHCYEHPNHLVLLPRSMCAILAQQREPLTVLQTKGLSLEEINGLFGDETIVTITRITESERAELDAIIESKGLKVSLENA